MDWSSGSGEETQAAAGPLLPRCPGGAAPPLPTGVACSFTLRLSPPPPSLTRGPCASSMTLLWHLTHVVYVRPRPASLPSLGHADPCARTRTLPGPQDVPVPPSEGRERARPTPRAGPARGRRAERGPGSRQDCWPPSRAGPMGSGSADAGAPLLGFDHRIGAGSGEGGRCTGQAVCQGPAAATAHTRDLGAAGRPAVRLLGSGGVSAPAIGRRPV